MGGRLGPCDPAARGRPSAGQWDKQASHALPQTASCEACPSHLPQRPVGRGQVREGVDRGSTGSDPRWCRTCLLHPLAQVLGASGQTGGSSFSRNSFTAAISCGQELCMTPGYVLNWTLAGVTTDRSFSAVKAPNRTGTMGSSSPWH